MAPEQPRPEAEYHYAPTFDHGCATTSTAEDFASTPCIFPRSAECLYVRYLDLIRFSPALINFTHKFLPYSDGVDGEMCTGIVTYSCSSPKSLIIWPILLTIAIILLNQIDCTRKKPTLEALPSHTNNSIPSEDTGKQEPFLSTTANVPAPVHRGGTPANAIRRIVQLHLLLAVTRQCTHLWACDDRRWVGALMYGIFMIAGGALVCPHEASLLS